MIQHMSVLSNALCALEKNVFCRCWVDFSINTLEGKWVGSLVVTAGLSRPISYGLCNPNCLSLFSSFSLSCFQSSVIICTYIQDSMSVSFIMGFDSLSLVLFFLHVLIWVKGVSCATACGWRSENNLGSWLSFFNKWIPEMELRLSGLVAVLLPSETSSQSCWLSYRCWTLFKKADELFVDHGDPLNLLLILRRIGLK